jgi:hypothetical protein
MTPRSGQLSWSRPVPETGTPVNSGNQPPRDNGEGEEWPSPLPTYGHFNGAALSVTLRKSITAPPGLVSARTVNVYDPGASKRTIPSVFGTNR